MVLSVTHEGAQGEIMAKYFLFFLKELGMFFVES